MNESIGLKFGNLTVLEIVPEKTKAGKTKCKCLCDCGNEHISVLSDLKSGNTKSCGCLKKLECRVGRKFGRLTIATHNPGDKMAGAICDCGVFKEYVIYNIIHGKTSSCGCIRNGGSELGNKFGLLTVIKENYSISGQKQGRLVIVKCDCGNEFVVPVSSLRKGNTKTCGCSSKYSMRLNRHMFKSKSKDSLYWAGFIAADGCVTRGRTLEIGLKESDSGHLLKIRNWLNNESPIRFKKSSNSASWGIANQNITEDLLEYGITPRKSMTYVPPLFCEESADFWRGMIDGDGHIGKSRPVVNLFGTSMACESFQRFVKTFCESKANVCKHGNIYSIRYSGKYAIQIMQKLYGNNPKFYLDRKYELANRFCNFDSENNQP